MGRLAEHGVSANAQHALPETGRSVRAEMLSNETCRSAGGEVAGGSETTDNGEHKTTDEETTDNLIAKFTGAVTKCPPGEGRAPDAKEYGQAQFRCACGHHGTMAYPKLFGRLRRRKPLRLRCELCGRVVR